MRLTATDLASERGGRLVFARLSFAVDSGGLLAVTGPNGAGKSTLLRILAGLLSKTAGEVALDPHPDGPRGIAMHYLGHRDGLKAAFTVRENLDFFARVSGPARLSAIDALDEVRLAHLIDLPAAYLSAGQRRRVAMARLVAVERPIWLLDEPTSAIDAAAETDLGRLIDAHRAAGGIVVAATHAPLPSSATETIRLGSAA